MWCCIPGLDVNVVCSCGKAGFVGWKKVRKAGQGRAGTIANKADNE
jgi:hypothetical protein